MPSIQPFLWFDTQAEEAAEFYVSLFPNSRVVEVVRYSDAGPGPAGSVMTVRFSLDGTELVALNGGPAHYGFNLGVSFVIGCAPEEVDHYWSALTDGGEEGSCGWLKDRFGLSWQVVPDGLPALLGDPDPGRASRALHAMLGMKKLDLAAMRAAADATCTPVSVSRRIEAPAETLFGLLARPATHPAIDGSGMLRAARSHTVISQVGDVFTMTMHNDEMGDYEMANHVVDYEPNRRIVWEPVLQAATRDEDQADIGDRAGHRWGYELTPLDSGSTLVTETFDCSQAPEWLRRAVKGGARWTDAMSATLEKLDALSRR